MNAVKTILLFMALPFISGSVLSASLIENQAPALFKYSSNGSRSDTTYVFRVHAFKPDLIMEWEHDYQLGAVIVPGNVMKESCVVIKRTRLVNGREILLDGNVLGISRDVYIQLNSGKKVKVKLNKITGWMKKTGETIFEFQDYRIPALEVEDNLGNRYILQKKPRFPLCLSYQSPHYSEKLVEYYSGPDVIFRWYK